MPKVKDMRPAPITWENRGQASELLMPIINDVLGVRFDAEVYNPCVRGVNLYIGTKYKANAPTWSKSEYHWQGTVIKLYFQNVDYHKVHRTLVVKSGEALDADKLRAKWAEMLELKAADEKRRQEEEEIEARVESLREMALNEAFALGAHPGSWSNKASFGRVSGTVQSDGTFKVELSGLTAAQLKAIANLLGSVPDSPESPSPKT